VESYPTDAITLTIDEKEVKAKKGMTVLEAALGANMYIPNLCYHPDLSPSGACRLCIVQINGIRGLPTACTTPAENGMIVHTDSPEISRIRRAAFQLLIASHPTDCLTCNENQRCELQILAAYLGITEQPFRKTNEKVPVDLRNPLFVRDPNKCILCGRCVRICQDVRKVGAISFMKRGTDTFIGSAFDRPYAEAGCRFCGACVEVCPTGALTDRDLKWKTFAEREAALIPCKHTCPAGVDVPRYIRLINEGKIAEATAVVREKVPFPRVLGRICIHPCEDECRRGELNDPIAIRPLKRFAADHDNGLWKQNLKMRPPTGKKIAIVGSGPAGLTAAYFLARVRHSVTVFEALPRLGGMMLAGIPEFRLPRDVLEAEIEEIKNIGVDVKTNTRIESLEPLFEQGYEAIFVAVGAHQCIKMGVDGEDSPGVIDCVPFLRNVNLGKKVKLGEKVAVIGGGNAAIDAARTALRLGAKEVTVIYRRTRADMPASTEEVDEALREGVDIHFLATPVKMSNEDGIVRLECIRMKLGELDATGRPRPIPIKGSEFAMEFNTVIIAIGQMPEIPAEFGLEVDRGNRVQVDSFTLATNRKGVFAGGDAVSGPASVIEAVASGRKAAIAIDKYLGGDGVIDEPLIPFEEGDPCLGQIDDFASWRRQKMSTISMEKRRNSFEEVELCFDKETAIKEAERCLRCNLRLQISPTILPPMETKLSTSKRKQPEPEKEPPAAFIGI